MRWSFLNLVWMTCAVTNLGRFRVSAEQCDEEILLYRFNKAEIFCPKSNTSVLLFAEPYGMIISHIAYSPLDGGTLFARSSSALVTFSPTNSSTVKFLADKTIDIPNRICPIGSKGTPDSDSYYPHEFIEGMAIHVGMGVVYFAYSCGKIVAYHLNFLSYAVVYEPKNYNFDDTILVIIIHEPAGLLIWATITKTGSYIYLSFMDGSGVKVLAQRSSIGGLAVDYETSIVYWVENSPAGLFQCDIDGNNLRKLNVVMRTPVELAAIGNIMYWVEWLDNEHYEIRRAHVKQETSQFVLRDRISPHIQIIPGHTSLRPPVANPCENTTCSQFCVPLSTTKHNCYCSDDYLLDEDGHNCTVRRHLLVSTSMGIFLVPAINDSASLQNRMLELNTSNPSDVQCDNAQGLIYWVEKDEESTRVMQADIRELAKGAKVTFKRNHSYHYPEKEGQLDVFALDWVASNIYMAFRGERRFRVCSITNNVTKSEKHCAELFGNQVGSVVGGLALDVFYGKLYWTQQDDFGGQAVVTGGMDGAWLKKMKSEGLKHPTAIVSDVHFGVYWVDSTLKHIELIYMLEIGRNKHQVLDPSKYAKFTPQRLAMVEGQLYWAGIANKNENRTVIFGTDVTRVGRMDSVSDSFFGGKDLFAVLNFSGVTGMSVYDTKSQKWKARNRRNFCSEGHSCSGICLLAGKNAFRCVCPTGLEPYDSDDKFLCKEPEKPTIVYGTTNGPIMIKNKEGDKESLLSNWSLVSLSYDPVGRDIIWHGGVTCSQQGTEVGEDCRKSHLSVYRQTLLQDGSL